MDLDDFSNYPYDPDMNVQEALREGLIVVIDGGLVESGYVMSCEARIPARGGGGDGYCTRNIGHDGVHSVTVRWAGTNAGMAEVHSIEHNITRVKQALIFEPAYREERVAILEKALANLVLQREKVLAHVKREREFASAMAEAAKANARAAASMNDMSRAMRDVGKKLADQKAERARQMNENAAAKTKLQKHPKDSRKEESRVDSRVSKPSRPPTWAEMAGSGKRNRINPKGQR